MRFHDLLNTNNICIDTTSKSKSSVLLNMSKILSKCHPELDAQELFNLFWERENLGSTAIGHGILIPHISIKSIKKTYACFMKLQNPVDFSAEDKQPVDIIFGLASAKDQEDYHLQILSRIVTIFKDPEFVLDCRKSCDVANLSDILTKEVTIQI